MTDRQTFESRLQSALAAYADEAPVMVDSSAMARLAAGAPSSGRRWTWRGPWSSPRWALAAVLGLLVLALVAATLAVGSRPPLDDSIAEIAPSASATSAPETPAPVESMPEPSLTRLPGDASVGVGVGPCAPVVQFLSTWIAWEQVPPVRPGPAQARDNGLILVAQPDGLMVAIEADGTTLTRVEPGGEPTPDAPPYASFPVAPGGRITPAPDGRAVAVEVGDLGAAGCSEPVIRFAHGGLVRPFGVRAYQAVRDVVWAADASALYGILRATIATDGEPLRTDSVVIPGDPGTILRWDVAQRTVADLGTPCGTCGLQQVMVSPDGARLVVWTSQGTFVLDETDAWRPIGEVSRGIGWTPPGLLIVDGYDRIDTITLDGGVVATSGRICCHGNGYGGVVSPDGSTVIGSTLRDDFLGRDVVAVDTATGAQRTIATMPALAGCGVFDAGSSGRTDCEARAGPSFGATPRIPAATILAWSPDGRWLLMWSGGTERNPTSAGLWIWAVDGSSSGHVLVIPASDDGVPPSAAWLPAVP